MKQSLELLMFAFLWHWPVSSFLFLFLFFFYLPSTLADSFSFFACPLFLSALVYLWGALLCFWSIKYRALLNVPEASGEHLFSCRWLSLLSALEACKSCWCYQLGLHIQCTMSGDRVESKDGWSRWSNWWKGSSFLILHLLKYSFTWRCPCILLKDKDSDHALKMWMSNLKDYNAYNDLALCLSLLKRFVIL